MLELMKKMYALMGEKKNKFLHQEPGSKTLKRYTCKLQNKQKRLKNHKKLQKAAVPLGPRRRRCSVVPTIIYRSQKNNATHRHTWKAKLEKILEILNDNNSNFQKANTTRQGTKISSSSPADYDKIKDICVKIKTTGTSLLIPSKGKV